MDPLLTLDMLIIGAVIFAGLFGFVVVSRNSTKQMKSKPNKFPPSFESKLSKEITLDVLEKRLTHLQTLKPSWSITEKVKSVGRLQARMTVPLNIAGGKERVSFLINLLVTPKQSSGCNVEWSYVLMSAVSLVSSELDLFEDDIYKRTTMELRIAMFEKQGERELADFIQKQLDALPGKGRLETSAPDSLFGEPTMDVISILDRKKAPTPVEVQKASTKLETPAKESIEHGYEFSVDTTAGAAESSASSLRADGGGARNSSNEENSTLSECPKCKQKRDPNFKFCLYCGQADS